MEQFKIRASATGLIMTNDRSGKNMGKTAESYLEQWYKEQLYGRRKEITSKYFSKGIDAEDGSVNMIADNYNYGLLIKNEQHFENDYIKGTPDIVLPDQIIEIKNSWDCFTFPLFENIPDPKYVWQCQSYMALTGREWCRLIYVLSNTPDHIIEAEAWKYCRNNGIPELDIEILTKFEVLHRHDALDGKLRFKSYEIERNDAMIESIYSRVAQCRAYLETIKL